MSAPDTFPVRGRGAWMTTYCNCGCGAVRIHAEPSNGLPSVTLVFSAAQAVEMARQLLESAEAVKTGVANRGGRGMSLSNPMSDPLPIGLHTHL